MIPFTVLSDLKLGKSGWSLQTHLWLSQEANILTIFIFLFNENIEFANVVNKNWGKITNFFDKFHTKYNQTYLTLDWKSYLWSEEAFRLAVKENNLPVVKEFLQIYQKIKTWFDNGDIEKAKTYAKQQAIYFGQNFDSDNFLRHYLHSAVVYNQLEICQWILTLGIKDISLIYSYAIANGRFKIFNLLINYQKPSVDQYYKMLQQAYGEKQWKIMKYLCSKSEVGDEYLALYAAQVGDLTIFQQSVKNLDSMEIIKCLGLALDFHQWNICDHIVSSQYLTTTHYKYMIDMYGGYRPPKIMNRLEYLTKIVQ